MGFGLPQRGVARTTHCRARLPLQVHAVEAGCCHRRCRPPPPTRRPAQPAPAHLFCTQRARRGERCCAGWEWSRDLTAVTGLHRRPHVIATRPTPADRQKRPFALCAVPRSRLLPTLPKPGGKKNGAHNPFCAPDAHDSARACEPCVPCAGCERGWQCPAPTPRAVVLPAVWLPEMRPRNRGTTGR